MSIVFGPVGSRGDVQPLVGLAKATQALGHDVTVATAPNFRGLVEGAGLHFLPVGEDIQAVVEAEGDKLFNPLYFIRRMKEFLLQQQVEIAQALDTDKARGLVTGPLLLTGPTIAEAKGIPFIGTGFFPSIMTTAEAPFPFFGLKPERRWLNRLSWLIGGAILKGLVKRVSPLRERLALPPIQGQYDYLIGTNPLLAGFDPAIAPLPQDWPKPAIATGFWSLPGVGPLPPEVEAFLGAGPPPVYIGFGSMPSSKPEARARAIIEGVQGAGVRAVILRGWAKLDPKDLPPEILTLPDLPHDLLFPRCSLIVHHGGAGTTGTASLAGVPQLIVPHAFDQPYWAARLEGLGCAAPSLKRDFTAEALGAGILEGLKPHYAEAALKLKGRMIPRGAEVGAELIVRHLLNQGNTIRRLS